jgi:hypoxanthine phosphoribosyltransferase
VEKRFIDANELLEDAFRLAVKIDQSGFRPDLIVGVWRGGTPVAVGVHEYFEYKGIHTDHIAIRASSYTGINKRSNKVGLTGLDYIYDHAGANDKLLIVDDVFDTGNSFKTILQQLEDRYGTEIYQRTKIACPWYKPGNNTTSLRPDFYLHETDQWLVFPHELKGLTRAEIAAGKPAISRIIG